MLTPAIISDAVSRALAEDTPWGDLTVQLTIDPNARLSTAVVAREPGVFAGGSVLTETVFAWPGIGRFVVDSIRAQDGPLVQGTVLFIAVVFIVINLLVDLSYALLNPRIRYG